MTSRHIVILLAFILASTAFAESSDAPILSVKGKEVYLYARQDIHSEVVTKLEKGEELIPFASAMAKGAEWHMVKTKNGVLGWVRSSDVEGTERLAQVLRENIPRVSLSRVISSSQEPTTIRVQMNGSSIIVPVVLNRTLKTHMIMDTGATFTTVTPRIAKKLGLSLDRYAPRVPLMTANGYITAPLSRLKSLKVGSAEVQSLVVAVLNFSSNPQIAGLLGLNFLNQFDTSIDSGSQRLTLDPHQE